MGATGWVRPPAPPAPALAPGEIALAVCGAHMSGLPLNTQIVQRNGRFLRTARSAPDYGFFALADGKRPGMVRGAPGSGAAVALEVWAIPEAEFGSFVAAIPEPLGIGTVRLEDGTAVKGFICEAAGLDGATDISALADWRAHLAAPATERGAA